MSEPMTAAEIEVVDKFLAVAPPELWADQQTLARWTAKAAAAPLGITEERCVERVLHYVARLTENEFRLPPLRYTAAMIEADALASACCGD